MADTPEVFNILKDGTSGAGEAAVSRIEGEAAASQAGMIGFSFKDSSGNVILPALNASGQLPVALDATTQCKTGQAKVTGSLSEATVVDVVLTDAKDITNIEVLASCFRATEWRLVHIDDPAGTPVETELAQFLSGAGQYTIDFNQACLKVAGASSTSGDAVIRLYGTNQVVASDMRGTISLSEAL